MFGLGGTMGRIAPVKGIRIRCLTTDLLEQKAEVHARTWRETYSGLLSQELVDAITPAFALKVTRLHDFRTVLLAMDGDAVVGYAEYLNPARPPSTYLGAAEVAALYVLKQYQGCGIGRRLFEEAMAATGVPNRIVVWMFRGNDRARAFYEHMGFHLTGRTQDADGIAGAEVELANFDTLDGTNGDSEASGERLKDLA